MTDVPQLKLGLEAPSTTPANDSTQELSETFAIERDRIIHRSNIAGRAFESSIPARGEASRDPKGDWWRAYLRGETARASSIGSQSITTVDLFCGPGGLALGVRQWCAEMGVSVRSNLAVDQDFEATQVYAANHSARATADRSVSTLIDFRIKGRGPEAAFSYAPEVIDADVASTATGTDVVLAGPPCQGHSNFNNQSRRTDKRNELYLTVPAFAVAAEVPIAIIENVPAVLNDASQVVESAKSLFESSGYSVVTGLFSADRMGWPQTRRRHFMVARRDKHPIPIETVSALLEDEKTRSLWWAIGDLAVEREDDLLHQPTDVSEENRERIDWLFDNDEYELVDSRRPKSHQNGHTYKSVYGRLHKELPAQTITTGFTSPGRGRYIHPTERRVLTPREAARLQGFPDTYDFIPDPRNPPSRSKLAKWIGDAVPMPLGYAAALSALAPGLPN